MKIKELISEEQIDELKPGQVPWRIDPRRYYGQGKQNARASKEDATYASQIYNQWSTIAVRIKQALRGDPTSNYKEGEYFKSFLSRALRIPAESDVFKQLSSMLGQNNENYPKIAKKAVDQAVAMRFMAQFPIADQSRQNPPSTKQPGFQAQASDGQTYQWMGAQWKNMTTGRIANRTVAAELNGAHP